MNEEERPGKNGARMKSFAAALYAGVALSLALSGCGHNGPSSSGAAVVPPLPVGDQPAADSLASAQASNWVTFQHDERRTGYYAAQNVVTKATASKMKLLWVFASHAGFKASPLYVNGTIYVADRHGQVTALDPKTGKPLWEWTMGHEVAGVLSYYNNTIFVGQHHHIVNTPWEMVALRPKDGSVLWQKSWFPGALRSYPVYINGTLYIGTASGDSDSGCKPGGVYAVNAATGEKLKESWLTEKSTPSDGGGVWGPISFDGTQLIFGTGNTCKNSPDTQTSMVATSVALDYLWNVQTVHKTFPSQSWDDDDLASGVALHNGVGYAVGKVGDLVAVNTRNGTPLWARYLGAPNGWGGFSTPVVTQNMVIASGGYRNAPQHLPKGTPPGGMLYGVGLGGGIKWRINTNYPILSSPVATPELVFVALDNSMAALDPQTGKILWRSRTIGAFDASPAITPNGQVVVGAIDRHLYCFGIPSATTPIQPSARAMAGVLAHTTLGVTQYAPIPWSDAGGVHIGEAP